MLKAWWVLASLGTAAAASLLLTPLAIFLATRLGLVDLPGPRKVHLKAVPRVGGVAFAVATLLAAGLIAAVPSIRGAVAPEVLAKLLPLAVLAGFVLLIGLADDGFDLSGKYKLLCLMAAAAGVCAAGIRIEGVDSSGERLIEFGWGAWPVTILWIVGITVSVNFIDGLDGLAGGIALITAATLAGVSWYFGQIALVLVPVALVGALAGFLVFNFHPARVFMGDSGSMFLGFSLASLSVLAGQRYGTLPGLVLPMLPMALPIIDVALTMVRRSVLQRRSVFSAEQGHVHHRLMQGGLSSLHTTLLLYAVSLIAAVAAVLMLSATPWLKGAGLCAMALVIYVVLRTAGSMRFSDTVSAIRRNRSLVRESKRLRHVFEDQQLRFRHVTNFDSWWQQVCSAGEAFEFLQLQLPTTARDGTRSIRKWCASDGQFDDTEIIAAQIPLKQRRNGSPLKLEVHVGPSLYLESASERLTLFARLMDEHTVARLQAHTVARAPAPQLPPAEKKRRLTRSDAIRAQAQAPEPHATLADESTDGDIPAGLLGTARVAIVHDFLYTYAGAERVLEQMLNVFPQAEVFALFDFLPAGERGFIQNKTVHTTFLQKLPFARKKHRALLPLMPMAIEQVDVSKFDVVLSSSYLAAKGVITRPDQLHLCYCHTPVRFAWDQQGQYLQTVGLTSGIKAIVARMILHYIRTWDVRSSNGVDVFLTNSDYVGRRIEKVYRRQSTTVYPPVDVEKFTVGDKKEDFYLTASRLVPYKRIDLIVEAFTKTPERRLIVVGDGPEMARLKAIAGPNVSLMGFQSHERLKFYMQHARAFVFAAEEDFGITPVEAMACGTPVIAYGRGGATESIVPGMTGILFRQQTAVSLLSALKQFEATDEWSPADIRRHAERFSNDRFRGEFEQVVLKEWNDFSRRTSEGKPPEADAAEPNAAEIKPAPAHTKRTLSDLPNGHQPLPGHPTSHPEDRPVLFLD